MVREYTAENLYNTVTADGAIAYKEYRGTSNDTKPTTGVATGSVFLEVDTGDIYLYDEDDTWVKQFSLQG